MSIEPGARITSVPLPTAVGEDILRTMVRIRRFEERVAGLQSEGALPGAVHLYIGQEAIAAGVCAALDRGDYVTSTHRGHGHILAKGGDPGRCMAELLGREAGYCHGKGGSMHIADMGLGIVGANGIVGAGLPIATGAALAARLAGGGAVSVCFFGDGAANQGAFHEALNLAALWSLPVVYVCESNGWGELTRTADAVAGGSIAARAGAYGMPGVRVDGNDASAVYAAAREAVDRARRGNGPTLLEAMTERIREHSEGLDAVTGPTRSPEELAPWLRADPIDRLRADLIARGVEPRQLDEIDAAASAEMDAAIRFARDSPPPAPEEAFTDMWASVEEGAPA